VAGGEEVHPSPHPVRCSRLATRPARAPTSRPSSWCLSAPVWGCSWARRLAALHSLFGPARWCPRGRFPQRECLPRGTGRCKLAAPRCYTRAVPAGVFLSQPTRFTFVPSLRAVPAPIGRGISSSGARGASGPLTASALTAARFPRLTGWKARRGFINIAQSRPKVKFSKLKVKEKNRECAAAL